MATRTRGIVRALLLLLTAAVVVASAPSPAAPGAWPAGGDAGREGEAACRADPAGLPPVLGPDGQPASYLHTCGSRIYDSQGREVRIAGLNWSGMEHGDRAPSGLGRRNWRSILDEVATLGYNTIRIPLSDDVLAADRQIGNVDFTLNADLQGVDGLGMLDRLVAGARDRGLKVILDRHYPASGDLQTLWYTARAPEAQWLATLSALAARYRGDDTVIGIDLANEPHGEASWGDGNPRTDWRLAAERGGNAVLAANPYLLVFVEGIENYDGDHYWWGGDLQGVRSAPVRLSVPNRVVYSPHDYGPAVSAQTWFRNPTFPANLPALWHRYWGYIQDEGIAPVVVGEFGGRSLGNDQDGQWQRALIAYLRAHGIGAVVWSLNPNWDTGGILGDDWRTIDQARQAAYQVLLAPPIGPGPLGARAQAPARAEALFRQDDADPGGGAVAFAFQVVNGGREPLALGRCELRYWVAPGGGPAGGRYQVEAGGALAGQVQVDQVAGPAGGAYLRVRFDPAAGALEAYRATPPVTLRYQRAGGKSQPQADDYSFARAPALRDHFGPWERLALYVDGRLASGREPPGLTPEPG